MMIHELHHVVVQAIVPVLPLLMIAAQVGKGLMDQAKAKRENARADALNAAIPQVDPEVQAHLNNIRLHESYAENGASRLLAYKKRTIQDAGEQARSNLEHGAGTSPGSLQQGFLRSQNLTQDALARAGADSESQVPQYMNMETPLISDIADRTLSTQEYLRDKTAFQGAQDQQNANNAFTGAMGLGSMFDVNGTTKAAPAAAAAAAAAGPAAGADPWAYKDPYAVPSFLLPKNYVMNADTPRAPITSPTDWLPGGMKPVF